MDESIDLYLDVSLSLSLSLSQKSLPLVFQPKIERRSKAQIGWTIFDEFFGPLLNFGITNQLPRLAFEMSF